MSLRLGDLAPDFQVDTTSGPISFHEYLGNSWGVLFSHPADFTPVCTTELGKTALLSGEFAKRNTKVLAVSVDDIDSHKRWLPDIEEVNGCTVNFPIIADPDRKIAELYDMIHPNASEKVTVRSVFIIGPDKKIKLTITYPASTGRNFNEILRVLDSLQYTANQSLATPADWVKGDDFIVIPAVPTDQIREKYGVEAKIVKPYLRYVPAEVGQ
jgi:alkyl hydroperoxide reductase subunit AhpC